MREIDFRAWNRRERKMFYNVQGTYDFMRGEPEPVDEESFGDVLASD